MAKRKYRKPIKPRKRPTGTKTAFVETLPVDMPIDEVIRLASEAGLSITRRDVWGSRWRIRKFRERHGLGEPATGVTPAVVPDPPKRSTGNGHAAVPDPKETQFRRLIMDLGMDRARVMWSQFERVYDGIGYMGSDAGKRK